MEITSWRRLLSQDRGHTSARQNCPGTWPNGFRLTPCPLRSSHWTSFPELLQARSTGECYRKELCQLAIRELIEAQYSFAEATMEDQKKIVKDYVNRELAEEGKETDLKEEENLLANGIVYSLGVLKLVSFIENEFNVQVPDEDVTVNNFRSLKSIGEYLEKRKQR